MHADQLRHLAVRHAGELPKAWLTGDSDYQKAAVLAAAAWHDVKAATDPELPDSACNLSHRENLIGIAESIIRGNMPDDSPFAQRAAQLWATIPTTNKETINA